MDLLYFIKEEYAFVKYSMSSLTSLENDIQNSGEPLSFLLKRMNLLVRIADEIILPELAEVSQKKLDVLAEAGNQTSAMNKLLESPLKTGRIGESRKRDLFTKMSNHIGVMEHVILPIFRDEISTVAREELGLVAADFKGDICGEAAQSTKTREGVAVVG